MKVKFTNAFEKDLSRIGNKKIAAAILEVIEELTRTSALTDISNLKKMKGGSHAFRIRVGDFRIGIYQDKDGILLARVLNRKDIYKYFP